MKRLGTGRIAAGLAALMLAGTAGCDREPSGAPVLHLVRPAEGPEGSKVAITVRGERFHPDLRLELGGATAETPEDGGFRLSLGATSLQAVRWVDGETLTAVVPETLPRGVHDLQIVSPDGQIVNLPRAYEALDAEPPTLRFLTPVPPEAAAPGADLPVTILVEDDGGVASIVLDGCLVADPEAADCDLEAVDAWAAETPGDRVTVDLSYPVDADAPEGAEVRLRAIALDALGNAAEARTVAVVRRAPAVLAVDPPEGGEGGGDLVEVRGERFDARTTFLFGEAPATAAVVDGTTAMVVTPPGIGTVDLVARRGRADAVLEDGFTFRPGPVVDAVLPAMVSASGGQVALVGAHLVPDTRVLLGELPVLVTWAVDDEVHVHLPAGEAGDHVLTVRTRFGEASATVGLTDAPFLDRLEPDRVPVDGGVTVEVHGQGFVDHPSLEIRVDGVPAPEPAFVASDRLTFLAPPGTGSVDVQVLSEAHPPSTISVLTYLEPPTAATIVPDRGPLGGGAEVVISGTGFVEPVSVTFDGVAADEVVVDGDVLRVTTPAAAVAGPVDVVVETDVGATTPLSYAYLPDPDVLSVEPAAGPAGEETDVVIHGAGFLDEAETEVLFGDTPATAVQVVSAERLEARAPALPVGEVAVAVRHPLQGEGETGTFAYRELIVVSLEPADGPESGGNVVVIDGRGFETVLPEVTFGGTDALAVERITDELVEVTVPAGEAGDVEVVVTLPGGEAIQVPGGYRYNPTPCVDEVRPGGGPVEGGNAVTIMGCDFLDGGGLAVLFDGVPAPWVAWIAEDEIRAEVPAAVGPGLVEVTVTSSRHDPASLEDAYRYGLGVAVIAAPAPGASVAPGEDLAVVVSVDGGGEAVEEVFVEAAFSGGGTETLSVTLDPAEPTAVRTFTVPVPADTPEQSTIDLAAWGVLGDQSTLFADPVTVLVTSSPAIADFWFEPDALVVTVGETRMLRLFALFTDGVVREIGSERLATFQVDGTAVTVTDQGVVRGEALGTATVTATVEGASVEAPVTVLAERYALDRSRLLMALGQTTGLSLLRYEGATVEDVTAAADWTALPVGTVTADAGLVTAVAVGTATVTATYVGSAVEAEVIVGDEDTLVILPAGAPWYAEGPALAFDGLDVPAGATLMGHGASCLVLALGEDGLHVADGGRIDVSGRAGMPGAHHAPRPPDLRRGGDGGAGGGGGGGGSVGGSGGDGNPPGEDTTGNSDDGGPGGGPGGGLGGVDAHSTARAGSAGGGGGYGGAGGEGGRVQFGSGAGGAGGPVNAGTSALGGSGGGGGDGGSVTGPHGTAGGGGGGGGCLDVTVTGGPIRIRGEVLVRGGVGGGAIHESRGGGGGGGSGGFARLVTDGTMSLSGTLSVAGGAGGSSEMEGSGQPGAGGGGGGGGRMVLGADRLEFGAVHLDLRGGPGGRVPPGPDPGEPGEPGVLEILE